MKSIQLPLANWSLRRRPSHALSKLPLVQLVLRDQSAEEVERRFERVLQIGEDDAAAELAVVALVRNEPRRQGLSVDGLDHVVGGPSERLAGAVAADERPDVGVDLVVEPLLVVRHVQPQRVVCGEFLPRPESRHLLRLLFGGQ
jgi:hypothetical protein